MATQGPTSSIAVDTHILLALADHHHEVWAAVKSLRKKFPGIVFILPPTVLGETMHHVKDSSETEPSV
jgi:hypothetical protein